MVDIAAKDKGILTDPALPCKHLANLLLFWVTE